MPHQKQPPDFIAHLDDRAVVRVTGPDAESFLQNVMTNDIRKVSGDSIVYSCLLSPQGQYLHDFFVVAIDGGYLVDINASRAEDFLRRIAIFKLRAKVDFSIAPEYHVYAGNTGQGSDDPRLSGLGKRFYTTSPLPSAQGKSVYEDFCISRGVPSSLALKQQKDVLADVNLDLLNAVAWDKGCYIGQEVTARMKYKALSKRRLFIVNASEITTDAGEMRQLNSAGTQGLAVLKLAQINSEEMKQVTEVPEYLSLVTNN